jgi:hypothetical protein
MRLLTVGVDQSVSLVSTSLSESLFWKEYRVNSEMSNFFECDIRTLLSPNEVYQLSQLQI